MAGCGVTNTPSAHSKKPSQVAAPKVLRWSSAPAMTLNTKDNYQATIHTTAGTFIMQLFSQQDPVAVNNFVFLANQHFFNGDKFFRVLKTFVIQTGDPLNNGTGGPGYTWDAELPPPFPYQPGIVAMAVSPSSDNTNGSQFFICTGQQSEQLNQSAQYTELGRITKGWATVEKIADGPVTTNPITNEPSYPIHPFSITSVTIQTSPNAS